MSQSTSIQQSRIVSNIFLYSTLHGARKSMADACRVSIVLDSGRSLRTIKWNNNAQNQDIAKSANSTQKSSFHYISTPNALGLLPLALKMFMLVAEEGLVTHLLLHIGLRYQKDRSCDTNNDAASMSFVHYRSFAIQRRKSYVQRADCSQMRLRRLLRTQLT